jgi:hypothetical protein
MKTCENFLSLLNLKFHDNELEKEYIQTADINRKFINIISSAFFLILSKIASIVFSIITFKTNTDSLEYSKIVSYVMSILHLISLILSIVLK